MAAAATSLILPDLNAFYASESEALFRNKKARNIIFMVSDGMSSGTLAMSDILGQRKYGKPSHWLNLYRENKVKRALMDMASASSVVTDSAAASSSWGGGHRVKNGRLNLGENGEEHLPIWQKFKKAGKKVGCVTTVPITHATPAGFCVVSKTRGEQAEIAAQYLGLKFDVMMGGGMKYFYNPEKNIDHITQFRKSEYQVVVDRQEMMKAGAGKPILGVFDEEGLPYSIDREHIPEMKAKIPSLAEMTQKAIEVMQGHKGGFCLQVEGGKVDWAAHANDAPALLYDQLAFDEAVKVVMDFAEKDKHTLVIITTDHGNANPGIIYGKKADQHFETLFHVTHSNTYLFHKTMRNESPSDLQSKIKAMQGWELPLSDTEKLLAKFNEQSEDGTYNEYKLPYEMYALMLRTHTSVHFNSTDHTSDYTELAMYGPGSNLLKPFIRNTDLHYLLLEAAEVENKF